MNFFKPLPRVLDVSFRTGFLFICCRLSYLLVDATIKSSFSSFIFDILSGVLLLLFLVINGSFSSASFSC
jgi:hypothetical protein